MKTTLWIIVGAAAIIILWVILAPAHAGNCYTQCQQGAAGSSTCYTHCD